MPYFDNRLKNQPNYKIFNSVRRDLSTDFRNRIPAATKGRLEDTLKEMNSYRPAWNEFESGLINRIGDVLITNVDPWANPLAQFKRPKLEWGDSIEEIGVGLLTSYTYDHDRDSSDREIWGTNTPDVKSAFHRINREEKYKVSVKSNILKRAFLGEDNLSSVVAQFMEAPSKSDNWDEFLIFASMFKRYEDEGGFYHMRIPSVSDLASGGDEARAALRRIKVLATEMTFLNTAYNAMGMPSHANPSDLILFCTPDFRAAVDVEALASAFHRDNLDIPGRVIEIPRRYWGTGMEHCEAILTTKDIFVAADTLFETTSIWDPANLVNNYWLHHHSIISVSQFVPAVMLSTKYDDETITVSNPVKGVEAVTTEPLPDGKNPATVERGGIRQMLSKATLTDPDTGETAGLIWSVSGNQSNKTYILPTGVLHAGEDEKATKVTVTATAFEPNSDGTFTKFSANKDITLTGDITPEWPRDHTEAHADDVAPDPGPKNPVP